MNGVEIKWRNAIQKHVTLFVTKVEKSAAITCAQDLIYEKHLLESMCLLTGGNACGFGDRHPRGS